MKINFEIFYRACLLILLALGIIVFKSISDNGRYQALTDNGFVLDSHTGKVYSIYGSKPPKATDTAILIAKIP